MVQVRFIVTVDFQFKKLPLHLQLMLDHASSTTEYLRKNSDLSVSSWYVHVYLAGIFTNKIPEIY